MNQKISISASVETEARAQEWGQPQFGLTEQNNDITAFMCLSKNSIHYQTSLILFHLSKISNAVSKQIYQSFDSTLLLP